MNYFVLVAALLFAAPALAQDKVTAVLVKKSERTLYLLHEGKIVKQYRIMLGPHAKGPKLLEGDERTPEGNYTLDFKNPNSHFYKSIRVSYPNAVDLARARQYHTDPGGSIMIHGMKNSWNEKAMAQAEKFNWTDGCIALKNSDMDEIWDAITVGTPIEIQP